MTDLDTRPQLPLRINFSWTLIGNVIYSICQWGMLTAIARVGTPQMVGKFALGLAITAPVIMFANLQLRAVLATDARQDYLFGNYLSLRYVSTALAILAIVGIALFGSYPKNTAGVIILVGLAKSFEALSDIYYGSLQRAERMDMIARRMIFKGILGLVLLCALLIVTRNVVMGIGGLFVANMITFLGLDIRTRSQTSGNSIRKPGWTRFLSALRGHWEIHKLMSLAWTALPLGAVMMLLSLTSNVPRYFLEHSVGEHELGIFAAIAYLTVAGTTLTSALGQSAIPRLATHFVEKDLQAYRKLLMKLVLFGLAVGILAIAIAILGGRVALRVLYGEEYSLHNDLLILLMIVGSIQFVASFLGYGMTAARRFMAQFPLFLIVGATTIITGSLWIPAYGLKGAAYVLLVSGGTQLIGSLVVLSGTLRLRDNAR